MEGSVEARADITVAGNVAVAGWDDIPAARHPAPPVTTLREAMTSPAQAWEVT
jgi:DNA-binding LacI/PurR family transcriptional regulator